MQISNCKLQGFFGYHMKSARGSTHENRLLNIYLKTQELFPTYIVGKVCAILRFFFVIATVQGFRFQVCSSSRTQKVYCYWYCIMFITASIGCRIKNDICRHISYIFFFIIRPQCECDGKIVYSFKWPIRESSVPKEYLFQA